MPSGGVVQKTFAAPNKRNAREPTDHDVQIISVYAPPPLPVAKREALGFEQVHAAEIEVLFDDKRDPSERILETQLIPFVADAEPTRLRRALLAAGVLVLSGIAGVSAYAVAPKIFEQLRIPASVAAVADALRPLPTPVARPTQSAATRVVPRAFVRDDTRDVIVTEAVPTDDPAPLAEQTLVEHSGSAELLAPLVPALPVEMDRQPPGAVADGAHGKLEPRAKRKKNRRFRARHKRGRSRAGAHTIARE
jgi:hypothetical protein